MGRRGTLEKRRIYVVTGDRESEADFFTKMI
jgi:hypothetical protein